MRQVCLDDLGLLALGQLMLMGDEGINQQLL